MKKSFKTQVGLVKKLTGDIEDKTEQHSKLLVEYEGCKVRIEEQKGSARNMKLSIDALQ